MAVTLAQPSGPAFVAGRRPLMEKFVIDGGIALSGTVVPAGNKNGALPILAASVLTEEEVVVRNVPKIKDAQAMISLLEALGVRVDWLSDHEVALCAARHQRRTPSSTAGSPSASARRSSSRARCSRASAASACLRRAATSSAAAASTRISTPSRRSARPSTTSATSS